jgi:hypothetical protein
VQQKTLLGLAVLALALSPVVARGDAAATIKADAEKIDADTKTLRDDQQKCRELIEPDRAALVGARAKYDADAAPLEAGLKALDDKWDQALKADRDAIDACRQQGEAAVRAIEQRLRQEGKKDKADKAGREADEAALKAAKQKLEDDVQPLEAKRKADHEQRAAELAAGRAAMKEALKDDVKAVKDAEVKLHDDSVWETKVEADRAILKADREKLAADKAAAGL